MTHTIPVTSTKHDRAIRFGRELERAMRTRGVGSRVLAEPLGASRTSVMYWRTGRILPRIETARRLAAALDWPKLASLAIDLRRKRCLVDDVEFVDDSGSDNRTYCSASCQRVNEKVRIGTDRRTRAARAERGLLIHQRAVAAFCAGCEPSGRCVTPECELRPVSPLPLFEGHIEVEVARARPHNGYRAPGADSARMQRVWDGYTADERAARIARAAEASKRARGLTEPAPSSELR